MAHLLQKSNQPSYNTNSWGGLFTCCFTHPKTPSPNPPVIPPVKVQGPLSSTTELPKERKVGDGNSVVSQENNGSAFVRNKVDASLADGTAASADKAMYNSWAGKISQDHSKAPPSVTLSEIAGRKVSGQAHSGQVTPDTHSSHTSVHEFVEENNPNGFISLPQGNLSLQEPLSVAANATVHTHVKMDYKSSEMTIQIKNVENAPGEENAGSQAYQVRLALIGLRKKKRWHSHIIPAPNPTFNEEAVFKGITSDELAKLALRIRLYGCRKHRRHFIFAESIVSFPALNLRGGEASIPFALISKVGHESVVDSDSDIGDESIGGSRFGSRLSLSSRASRRSSSRIHQSGSEHQRPHSARSVAWKTANAGVLPELATARRVVADREANWPELLCGLAYNATTKRLSISVLRTNRLKVPEASFKSPKVFVSLTLVSEAGEEIMSSQTHDVHLAANTEFGEKFAFDMNFHSPREVTLFVRVFQKHHMHKHDSLGWFAMGLKNNGEEERSHWNEMLQAQGKEISRWHVLNENAP